MKKLKAYIKRIYRLSIGYKKQEKLVWEDLKQLHSEEKWESGVYENEKHIETKFSIAEQQGALFYYSIYEGEYHCRVKVLDGFSSDMTTDIFILAAHFNNLLNYGAVVVNVQYKFVEYRLKTEILMPLLYPFELYSQLMRHYHTAKDVTWAFQELTDKNEAPALIIADLFKKKEEEEKEEENKN